MKEEANRAVVKMRMETSKGRIASYRGRAGLSRIGAHLLLALELPQPKLALLDTVHPLRRTHSQRQKLRSAMLIRSPEGRTS